MALITRRNEFTTNVIVKVAIFSIVLGLKDSYFLQIYLPIRYRAGFSSHRNFNFYDLVLNRTLLRPIWSVIILVTNTNLS